MKKTSTHYQAHTIDPAGNIPEGEDPGGEGKEMKQKDIDPAGLLDRLVLRAPDRVMKRLFLKIRISTVRNRN